MLPDNVGKVLVCEIAGLGDNVHLLPALWLVRQRWPHAELHVMVAQPLVSLFDLTPWVQRVWGYSTSPKPRLGQQWRIAAALRAQQFDVVIDTKCTDRSSLLCWLTRAPVRLGRRPSDGGPVGWRHLFTRVMDRPYYTEPMYLQKWHCLRDAGLVAQQPEFHVEIDPARRRVVGINAADDGAYLHVSPCTSSAERELPSTQLADLLTRLLKADPRLRLVVSCSAQARERVKVRELLSCLNSPPWKVFEGVLDVASLAAVIHGARMSMSGDTGSLHLAVMSGVPALAWFRAHRGQDEWIPTDRLRYRVLVGPPSSSADALSGLETDALFDAARALSCLSGSHHA